MAWLLKQDATPFAFVKLEVEPPCSDLRPPRSYYAEKGVIKPLGGPSHANIDIEDKYWPKRARLQTDRNNLPNLINFCGFFGVSAELRDVIEEFDLGIHEFRLVDLWKRSGEPFPEKYFAINIRRRLPGIVDMGRSKCTFTESPHGPAVAPLDRAHSGAVTVLSQNFAGIHLFNTPDIVGGNFIVSDALHDKIVQNNLCNGIITIHLAEYAGGAPA